MGVEDLVERLKNWQQQDSVLGTGDYDQGLMCGVEDRGLQKDGYSAMRYGYDRALERVAEEIDGTIAELAAELAGLREERDLYLDLYRTLRKSFDTYANRTIAAESALAAERGKREELRNDLGKHYLHAIVCNHTTRQDKAHCSCSFVDLGWQPSIGDAVESWIEHFVQVTGQGIPTSSIFPVPSAPTAREEVIEGAMRTLLAEEITQPGWYANGNRFVEIVPYQYPVYKSGILRSIDPNHIERWKNGLLLDGQAYRPDWGSEPFYGPISIEYIHALAAKQSDRREDGCNI